MKVMNFNLTDRAAAIAKGWTKHRRGSARLSRLIEDFADAEEIQAIHRKDYLLEAPTRRLLSGKWHLFTDEGWKVIE